MKKLFTIFLIAAVLCITGCKHGTQTDDNTVSTTVNINQQGEVYLVKLNTTSNTVYKDNTGYIKKVTRSAQDEVNTSDTDSFIRNLNHSIAKQLVQQSGARVSSVSIKSDTITLTETKGSEDTFSSYIDEKKIGTVTAKLEYIGTHCLIYSDKENEFTEESVLEDLGKNFDDVYDEVIKINGNPVYDSYVADYFVPCTNKITILVSDLFGDADPTIPVEKLSGTVGYFYSADLLNDTYLSQTYNSGITSSNPSYIHSNGREMFYIDSLFLEKAPGLVTSTLVHEFNHMINFVIKTMNPMVKNQLVINKAKVCDVWFTEMLAMTTEDMFQEYLGLEDKDTSKSRLPYFGMIYNYGFKNWGNEKVDQLAMYANTYAYGAFLARNFGGVELIKEIAQNDYVDETAITKALQKQYPSFTYKDPVTNVTKAIDFMYTLQKFVNCIIFTESNSGEYSLNHEAGFKNGSKIGFRAIDMKMTIAYQGKNYQLPLVFKNGKDGQIDIYSYGFSVHRIGTNISSFTLTVPKDSRLEYYYVIK